MPITCNMQNFLLHPYCTAGRNLAIWHEPLVFGSGSYEKLWGHFRIKKKTMTTVIELDLGCRIVFRKCKQWKLL